MAAAASKWASFRRHFVRPEIYPLVGAVGTAVGLCIFFGAHKATGDPTVTWDRAARSAGTGGGVGESPDQVLAEEARPEVMTPADLAADEGAWGGKLWSSAVRRSTGIFTKEENHVAASNRVPNPVFPTVAEARAAEERAKSASQ